jgi:hypothetical protein
MNNKRNLILSEKRSFVPAFSNFEIAAINEGSELSTDMEKFIAETLVLRATVKTDKSFRKAIDVMLSDPNGLFVQFSEADFVSTFKTSLKKEMASSGESLKTIFGNYLYRLGQEIKNSYPEALLNISETSADGASKQQISTYWRKFTPDKNLDTPKTDIIIQKGGAKASNLKVSIKNVTSQFMSGEKKETKATIYAAIDILKDNKIKGIEEFTTKANSFIDNMVTIKTPVKSISFELDNIKRNIELNGTGLRQLYNIVNTGKPTQRPARFKKAASSISADLKVQLDAALERLKIMDEAKKTFSEEFVTYLNTNSVYKEAIIYEAASGHYKFNSKLGGSDLARADYIIVWNNNIMAEGSNIVAIKPILSFKDIKGKIDTFGKINFELAFKSNSIKKKIDEKIIKNGYSMFAVLRIGTQYSFGKKDESLVNLINEEEVLTPGELIEKAINAEVDEIIQKMNMNEAIADDIMSYFTRLFEKIKAYYKTIDDSVNEFAEDLRIALQDEFSEFLGHMGIILNVKSLNEFIESENNTYGAIFQS